MTDTIFIIEDEVLLGNELARHFRIEGWEVVLIKNLEQARNLLIDEQQEPLVVLSDLNLPDGTGLDLLEACRKHNNTSEWIFLTAYGSVPESVRALRLGAFDFIEKPCALDRLDLVVSGAKRSAQAQRRLKDETRTQTRLFSPISFYGQSEAAQQVRDMLLKISQVPFSALIISGETGTGKGLAARIIHHSGCRSEGPLVEVNCAAFPRDLLESELFGHESGAFTGARARRRGLFEQASGGTLFLDEIGELDLDLQSKLLKAIEDKKIRRLGGENEVPVDVQIVAASNLSLPEQISKGKFRADLYHRLCVFQLYLPSLVERKQDLHDLVPAFIREYNSKAHKSVKIVPPQVWTSLEQHDWPGNVRELRNVVERCVLFSSGEVFPMQWLSLTSGQHQRRLPQTGNPNVIQLPVDGSMALDDMDKYIIQTTLERCQYNVTAAARFLGTTRETLRYRIQKYNLRKSMAVERV